MYWGGATYGHEGQTTGDRLQQRQHAIRMSVRATAHVNGAIGNVCCMKELNDRHRELSRLLEEFGGC